MKNYLFVLQERRVLNCIWIQCLCLVDHRVVTSGTGFSFFQNSKRGGWVGGWVGVACLQVSRIMTHCMLCFIVMDLLCFVIMKKVWSHFGFSQFRCSVQHTWTSTSNGVQSHHPLARSHVKVRANDLHMDWL